MPLPMTSIARWIFRAQLVCLTLVLIPLAISFAQVLAVLPRQGFPENFYGTLLGRFFLPGPGRHGRRRASTAQLEGPISVPGQEARRQVPGDLLRCNLPRRRHDGL